MKLRNSQKIEIAQKLLDEALSGVQNYLAEWPIANRDFTTENELRTFANKLCEMRGSLDRSEAVSILGMWRIMETWPYQNELRKKIVEAELAYERAMK